jgi:hypothetical protein
VFLLRRIGFFVGLGVAGVASAALVFFGVGALMRSSATALAAERPGLPPSVALADCQLAPPATSPVAARTVTSIFLRTAVLRRNTVCSYELVTPVLRQGLSREEWATGNIPVQPFPTVRLETVEVKTQIKQSAPARRAVVVVLTSADLGEAVFEAVLVRRGDHWLVDYFQPKGMPPIPAAG